MELWKELGDTILVMAAILSAVFAIMYALLAPWYRSPLGRSLFTVLVSLGVSIAYFAWAVSQGGRVPTGFYPIRALLFSLIALGVGVSIIVFARAQNLGHPKIRRRKERGNNELEDSR